MALALVVVLRPLLDAGKNGGGCWQDLSALPVVGLLLSYGLGQGGGWFLAAAALVLKRGGLADVR